MPLIDTPFDSRVSRLRDRLKDDPRNPKKLRHKLQKFQTKQYYSQQRNMPPPPTPWSAKYETTVGGLRNTLNQTNADLAGRELAVKQQYGLTDHSNPFASARMLERNFAQQKNRTGNSYAARGQLYSGALSNARAGDEMGFNQGLDALSREYQAKLGEIGSGRLSAQREYDEGVSAAEAQRLEDALNAPVDPLEAGAKPDFARRYESGLRDRMNKAKRRGKDKRANRIRDRLHDL